VRENEIKEEKTRMAPTSPILSNSSIQTIPRSAKTMAPASNRFSPVSGSIVTAAVKPTPDEPRPVVEMAKGAISKIDRNN
jgi:hypothetical protein